MRSLCGTAEGGDQVPAVPVEHFGVVLGQRALAFPGPGQACLAAGMAELDGGGGALGLDEGGDARQAGDELVLPQPEVADGAATAALDLGGFDHHQPAAAGSIAANVHQVPVGGEAPVGGVLVHWGKNDTVAQRDVADRQRGEQQRHGHIDALLWAVAALVIMFKERG
jgi:hypothetical protein